MKTMRININAITLSIITLIVVMMSAEIMAQRSPVLNKTIEIGAPPLILFGIPTQVFFSDIRRQKRQPAGEAGSLAVLNEYFGNLPLPAGEVAGKKPKLGNKMELLEVPLSKY